MTWLIDRQRHYCIIFALQFSPCGKYLVAGDSYGRISVFRLSTFVDSEPDDASLKPFHQFAATKKAIYCFSSTECFLICGSDDGIIRGYRWDDLKQKTKLSAWEIDSNAKEQKMFPGSCYEVNSLAASKDEEYVISGGNKNPQVWNLENGTILFDLTGHTDFVHSVSLRDSTTFLSASEDGTVRLWDLRTKTMVHMFDIANNKDLSRSKHGNWVGCVAAEQDWMVCGGGPKTSLWHLGSTSLAHVLDEDGETELNSAMFYDEKIICGGSGGKLDHWDFTGTLKTGVRSELKRVYDVKVNRAEPKYKMLVSSGTSANIDVYLSFGYKSYTLRTF